MSVSRTITEGSLQRDPTHTLDTRRQFIKSIERRFREVRGIVRQTVGYENDALHLKQGTPTARRPRSPIRQPEPEPVEDFPVGRSAAAAAFAAWFANLLREKILAPTAITERATGPSSISVAAWDHWTRPFVEQAVLQGANQSRGLLLQEGINTTPIPDGGVTEDDTFHPVLRTRYWSAFDELDGITEDMAQEIDRTLRQGLDEGWNPRKMAREMTQNIRAMEHTRARTLARTETMFAHSQAAVKRYQNAGVAGIAHVGRLVTPDDRLCAFCRRLADETFTLDEFMGTRALFRGQRYFVGVPAHPNCRCAPIPKPGVDAGDLDPLEDRVPGQVIGEGLNMFRPSATG